MKLNLNQKEKVTVIGKLTKEIIELLEIEIDEEKNIKYSYLER